MRVLFLEHPMPSNGSWSLYEGLCRILGYASVIDFPYKGVFHAFTHDLLQTEWYRMVYREIEEGRPLPQGIPPLVPGESLTTGNQRLIVRDRETYYTNSPSREHTEDEVIADLDASRFDLIILSNSHSVPTIALGRLRDRAKHLPPIVYYDPGERDELNAHWWHVFRPALTFKMTLTPSEFSRYPCAGMPDKVYPLPLGNAFVVQGEAPVFRDLISPGDPRPIDVLCNLGATHEDRAAVSQRAAEVIERHRFSAVQNLRAPRFFFGHALSQGERPTPGVPYHALMAASRAVVSLRGSARDTPRYWQSIGLGAGLVADGTMGCVQPFPFRDREHGWFYRTLDELETAIVEALSDEQRRDQVARAAHAHLCKYHSIEARALFFLGIVRERLGIADDKASAWAERLGWPSVLPEWQTGPVVGFGQADFNGRLDYSR